MRHPRLIAWEKKLKKVFDGIDDRLEENYGDRYPLHPARAARGQTANKSHDGLFNVGAAFSAGYGSERGRGYIVSVRMATLAHVPAEMREKIEDEVAQMLRADLPGAFPNQDLRVHRDGPVYKIYGDLSLGEV